MSLVKICPCPLQNILSAPRIKPLLHLREGIVAKTINCSHPMDNFTSPFISAYLEFISSEGVIMVWADFREEQQMQKNVDQQLLD